MSDYTVDRQKLGRLAKDWRDLRRHLMDNNMGDPDSVDIVAAILVVGQLVAEALDHVAEVT
jgi:hypothetical protein